jgi:hypothetical protein
MKLISVHTPKSSGTTLIAAFSKIFGNGLAVETSDDPANPLSPRTLDPGRYGQRNRALPEAVQCLHGHFHPGQFARDAGAMFTMLRHPVDNLISIYFFWKGMPRHGNPLHDYWLDNNLQLLDTAKLPALRWLFSRSYFGDFDMSRFAVIGSYENRSQTLQKLGELIGQPLDLTLRENVTEPSAERAETMADHKLLSQLRDILIDDIRFYDRYA